MPPFSESARRDPSRRLALLFVPAQLRDRKKRKAATLMTNHSATLNHHKIMVPSTLSESQLLRLEKIFREAFGRELTSEERKFLGLSVVAAPPDEDEQLSSRKASA
jgi:hypothetical protein